VRGLAGVVRRQADPGLEQTFDRLSATDVGKRMPRAERRLDPNSQWAIGRTHHGILQPEAQLDGDSDVHVLFHGDLDNAQEIATEVRIEAPHDPPAIVRALYARDAATIGQRLHGAFCAVILDRASRTLMLITDRLGSYPLYWSATERGLVFASSVQGILRCGEPRDLDPVAVADCLTFGFPLGTKTLARSVKLVPPASVLRYSWDSGEIALTRYWDLASSFRPWSGTKSEFFEEVIAAFQGAVGRAFAGNHACGLALSGGLDSRAILSAVNGRASTLLTYTLGVDGCADHVIADRLASLAGTRHLFFELGEQYLADFLPNLEQMVALTDGMYLSHGLTEMLALNHLRQTGIEVLVRGHGGELAKASTAWPFHTDGRIRAMRDRGDLVPYLLGRMNYISGDIDLGWLFTPEWAREMKDAARTSLEAAVRANDLPPADACTYLYATEHHRRSTIPSLELFRDEVEVRLPFFDDHFLHVLLQAPAAWRDGVEIHRVVTARGNRRLLDVRNSNTGAPGSANAFVEAVFDKLNTVLRRLNVNGYRHYHEFDAWMRAQLLDHVESVLLTRPAIERGMLQPSAVRELIAQTRSGTADRAYLLLVLLIFEIWQRQNAS
jgi:asparagine synthase (glutamine-hydrolysing)